jgi:hypothetical protein
MPNTLAKFRTNSCNPSRYSAKEMQKAIKVSWLKLSRTAVQSIQVAILLEQH